MQVFEDEEHRVLLGLFQEESDNGFERLSVVDVAVTELSGG